MTAEVLTRIEGKAGRISLNRPAALHALNIGMVHAMTAQLLAWKKSRKVACVMIDHSEGRGFCAGGDIRFLQDSALKDGVEGRKFFHDEYQLNHLLFTYEKPVIAFMDGWRRGHFSAGQVSRRDREYAFRDAGNRDRPVPRCRRRLVSFAA